MIDTNHRHKLLRKQPNRHFGSSCDWVQRISNRCRLKGIDIDLFGAINALIHTTTICGDISRPLFIQSTIFASLHSCASGTSTTSSNRYRNVSKHVFQQQQSPAVKKKTRRKISEENAFKKSFGNFTCACVLLLCACVSVCKRWPHFHWLASWLAARTRLSCPAKATTAWRRPHASERSQWFACSTFTPNAWFLFCVFFLWFLNDRAWRPVCVRVSMWMMNDDDEIELKAPR